MKNKKDFFNGNIKHEYISYIWTSLIVLVLVFFGFGGMFLYLSLSDMVAYRPTAIFLLCLGIAACLFGSWFVGGTIFVIRKYPKYKKITKWFLNSDCYFVDSNSKEYRGHWRGKAAFDMVTQIAEQNKDLENIKYPKQYTIFIILTVIGTILMFVNIVVVWLLVENISILPQVLQNEYTILTLFVISEMLDIILTLVIAFKIKNIRKATIKAYRAE